jgi:hypothetical protein
MATMKIKCSIVLSHGINGSIHRCGDKATTFWRQKTRFWYHEYIAVCQYHTERPSRGYKLRPTGRERIKNYYFHNKYCQGLGDFKKITQEEYIVGKIMNI